MRTVSKLPLLTAGLLACLPIFGCSDETANPVPSADKDGGISGTSSSGGTGGTGGGAGVTGPIGPRSDLPVDARVSVEHLSSPVDVVRDKDGRPHIYASNIADAMRVQGYLCAEDRHFQLEFSRRSAEGRLAEVFADADPSTIDLDINIRTLGIGRLAKAQYAALPSGEFRDILDAYADGVTQVFRKIRGGELKLPKDIVGVDPSAFTDWTGADSLAVMRFTTYLLSFDADLEINTQLFFDAARFTFTAGNADPLLAKRAGMERDFLRFAPADPASTTAGYPAQIPAPPPKPALPKKTKSPAPLHHLAALTEGVLRALARSREIYNPIGIGSNNWAVSPARSATGHALLAGDPHLAFSAPAFFWPVSLDVSDKSGPSRSFQVSGVAEPGIPGPFFGHNAKVGWVSTVANYDATDLYAEQLSPDAKSVMWKGKPVPIKTVNEVIPIHGKPAYTYPVQIVPHHGPIAPNINKNHTVDPLDPQLGALSVRWTGLDAPPELPAFLDVFRAKNVDEARQALKSFTVGTQNWVVADTAGDVLWSSYGLVPIRDPKSFQWNPKTYQGTIPCLVLPGDGSAEWTGYLSDAAVPWEKNPAAGYIATANNDPIGDTADNDPTNGTLPDGTPMYLNCNFDIGLREGRIQSRLKGMNKATPADMAALQADVRSPLGAALAPLLVDAIDRAEEERKTPGAHPDLTVIVADTGYTPARVRMVHDLLVSWGKDADYRAASGIDPDTNQPLSGAANDPEVKASQATLFFNTWLVRLLKRTFGDEITKMGGFAYSGWQAKAILYLTSADQKALATFDAATGDSSLWDDLTTPAVESRKERMIRALLDTFTTLDKIAGPDPLTYRWGASHTVTFGALVPLYTELSIPPASDKTFAAGFPRTGDMFTVDVANFNVNAKLTADPNFTLSFGPAQRLVIDMDPTGPRAENALPGGAAWDPTSPHFRDQAELWRKNQTHPVPFVLPDVIAAKESRTVAAAP
jgi:penicillin G amidase